MKRGARRLDGKGRSGVVSVWKVPHLVQEKNQRRGTTYHLKSTSSRIEPDDKGVHIAEGEEHGFRTTYERNGRDRAGALETSH